MPGPTDLEQLLLEYINDARIDPLGDAARYIKSYAPLTSSDPGIQQALTYFGVSGSMLQSQFAALTAAAPVAWNDNLAVASRNHSQAMINAATQDHNLPGETTFPQRDIDAGYTGYSSLGENIFAYASSDLNAQAAFMVDWGGTANTGGMQSPPGHRNNIMASGFREIGIGILSHTPASQTDTGPLVITEDFGARFSTGAIILGTAYNDTDHNNFYSVGEGLGTLVVSVGASSETSWSSGGFSLILEVTGAQTVNFSGAGLSGTVSAAVTLMSSSNLMFEVVNGNTLQTTASTTVTGGALQTLMGLGIAGLTLNGGAGVSNIVGSKGNDTITGGSGNNLLTGGLGNDTIDGGAGTDTAVYSGLRSAYTVSTSAGGTTTVAGPDGTDTLTHIESLQFSDQTVSLTAAKPVLHDINGDGKADLVWRNNDGSAVIYFMNGGTVLSAAGLGNPGAAWKVKSSDDLNGDGKSDLVWQNDDGTGAVWLMNGSTVSSTAGLGNPGAAWKIKATGDLNGDGKSDIVWQNTDGTAVVYFMNGSTISSIVGLGNPGPAWSIKAAGDFNGDGKSDILWQNSDGTVVTWLMNGSTVTSAPGVGNPGTAWHIRDTADFNGDGKSDILWQNDDGTTVIWFMNGATVTSSGGVGNPGSAWHIEGTGDINGDGKADITWHNDDGTTTVWLMNGSSVAGYAGLGNPGSSWHVVTG